MDRYFGRFWIDWNIFYFFIDYEPKVEENMEEDLLTLRFFDLMVSVDVVI